MKKRWVRMGAIATITCEKYVFLYYILSPCLKSIYNCNSCFVCDIKFIQYKLIEGPEFFWASAIEKEYGVLIQKCMIPWVSSHVKQSFLIKAGWAEESYLISECIRTWHSPSSLVCSIVIFSWAFCWVDLSNAAWL